MDTDFKSLFLELGVDYYRNPILSDDLVSASEKSLNCTLPKAYKDILLISNGGVLYRNSIVYNASGENKVATLCTIYGIGGMDGIDSVGENHITRNEVLITNWMYPAGSVIFSHSGDSGFYFDYSKCGRHGEPEVYYQIALSPSEISQNLVRLTFDDFLADLTNLQSAEETVNRANQ